MAELPKNIPVKPPEMNRDTKPTAKSDAGLNLMFALYIVEIQLKTLTAEGTAMINVKMTKKFEINGFTPDMNMW